MTDARAAVTNARSALVGPIACGCCLLAGATYVAAVDPSDGGFFLPCPFRIVTRLWCPGCGLTRATHRLLRGDLIGALRYNVFVVLVLGVIIGAWLSWLASATGRPIGWTRPLERRAPLVAATAVTLAVAFAVVRNLPGVDGLRG